MSLSQQRRVLKLLNTMIGALLCAFCAALVSAFHLGHDKAILPILFIGVPVFLASRFGTMAGVLGTLSSAWIFSYYLYPGYHIQNPAAKANLDWFLLAAIPLSFLFAQEPRTL